MRHHRRPPLPNRLLVIALAAPLALGLSGCVEVSRFLARPEATPAKAAEPGPQVAQEAPEPIPAPQEKPKPGKLYEWSGDGRRVSRIVVNTDEQKARFYDGDEQIGWTTVASGVSKFPTPTGHFEVMEKVANKRSNLYGKIYGAGGKVVRSDAKAGRDPVPAGARFEGAKMPYFLRLTNDGIGLHAGPIPRPGRPASHGCIRMPSKLAPVLFEHVNLGTKVSIVGSGPDYGNYVQKQRAIAAREKERREAAAREQAIAAAAASTAAPGPGTPADTAIADPSASFGAATSRSIATTETVADTRVSSPPPEAPKAPPSVAAPPAPESGAAPLAEGGAMNPAPQATAPTDGESAGSAPHATETAPVTQTTAPQPSHAATPAVGTPAIVQPMPGYPAPVSPLAPPPYYAPPMRPAAAAVPAPMPAPVAAPAPAPLAAPPESPSTSPNLPVAPSATPAPTPDPPPAVSADQPRAPTEANDG